MHTPTATDLASPIDSSRIIVKEAMTPFRRIARDVTTSMVERATMLAQPPEVYASFFGGRVPSLAEKVQFIEAAIQRMAAMHIFENNLYHVEIVYGQPFIHLDVHRIDRGPCKNWEHFQQIKNELVGPEHEAVELFPAESRLVNTSHEYHMWVHADPGYRFPFGFGARWVLDNPMKVELGSRGSNERSTSPGTDRVSQTSLRDSSAVRTAPAPATHAN
jgi:hypothetical protein